MVTAIEDNSKSSGDFVIGNKGRTVILTRHTDLVVRDVILFQKLGIGLGIWLGHQSPNALLDQSRTMEQPRNSQYRFQSQLLEVTKVLHTRKATSVYLAGHKRKIIRRNAIDGQNADRTRSASYLEGWAKGCYTPW
jgi:hypothetical protein